MCIYIYIYIYVHSHFQVKTPESEFFRDKPPTQLSLRANGDSRQRSRSAFNYSETQSEPPCSFSVITPPILENDRVDPDPFGELFCDSRPEPDSRPLQRTQLCTTQRWSQFRWL